MIIYLFIIIILDSGQYGNINKTTDIQNSSNKIYTNVENVLLVNNSTISSFNNKESLLKDKVISIIQTTLKTSLQKDEDISMLQKGSISDFLEIFFLYLLHALPYTQSSFNWLFYAFLNQNLRNPGKRNGSRNVLPRLPDSGIDNQNHVNDGYTSVIVAWKNFSSNITSNIFNSPRHKKNDNNQQPSKNCESYNLSPDM